MQTLEDHCHEYIDQNFSYGTRNSAINDTRPIFPSHHSADTTIGILLVIIGSFCSIFNLYLLVVFSQRRRFGVTNLLIQIASIDFISGLLALVMAKNMLTSGNRKEYLHNIFLNITLCQIPGILYQVFTVALPILLMYLTIWRLVAVSKPHKYCMYLVQYRRVHYLVFTTAWMFGLALGIMPFVVGENMCYIPEWAFCDYRIAVVIENKVVKHITIGVLTLLPTLPSYFVIVCGSLIVSYKLFKLKSVKEENIPMKSATDTPRSSLESYTHEMRDREKSVVISTLIMALSYFVTNFPWVAYILIYMFTGTKSTFIILSGGNKEAEMYLYNWYYAAHALSGLVNAVAQIACCKELNKPIVKLFRRFDEID